MSRSIISIKNLTWGYSNSFSLNDVSFSIPEDSRIGIMGPNGAGKSTIIKLILKILNPPKDSIFLEDIDIFNLRQPIIAKHISYVPQLPSSPEGFTTEEIIRMSRYVHGSGFTKEDDRIIASVLKRLSLEEMRSRSVSSVSGGEFQRVLLARALAQQTELVILDEPTNHLDLTHTLNILDLLKQEQKQRSISILAVFHDINFALDFCDYIIILKEGSVITILPPEELLETTILEEVYNLGFTRIKNPVSSSPYVIPGLR